MKKKLYLITTDFPFGRGEASFIMPELSYLKERFDITVISNSLEEEQTVELDGDIRVIHYDRKASVFRKLWDSLCYFGNRDAWKELADIVRSRELVGIRFLESVLFFEEARRFQRFLKKNHVIDKNEPAVIYNYWFTYYCLTMTRLFAALPQIRLVTRAHRYDLYDEGYRGKRQPFKRQMDAKFDSIVFIAEHGRQYYLDRYSYAADEKKYPLFRLGVTPLRKVELEKQTPGGEFLLVSCSLIIPRKRVDLIIDGLAEIMDFPIKWVHFGDGEDFDPIVAYAAEKLNGKPNVSYEFAGYAETEQIMGFYEQHQVDAFITTTESEGCPVSVQEAMAYGIPIIGTEVAEIPYMIDQNGVLLSTNPTSGEVSEAIRKLYEVRGEEKAHMREQSRTLWKGNFDGTVNAKRFADFLFQL